MRKCVKTFYWSTLDAPDELTVKMQRANNPEKKKAYAYAKKVHGSIIRIKKYPEDEGIEYRVYGHR